MSVSGSGITPCSPPETLMPHPISGLSNPPLRAISITGPSTGRTGNPEAASNPDPVANINDCGDVTIQLISTMIIKIESHRYP